MGVAPTPTEVCGACAAAGAEMRQKQNRLKTRALRSVIRKKSREVSWLAFKCVIPECSN